MPLITGCNRRNVVAERSWMVDASMPEELPLAPAGEVHPKRWMSQTPHSAPQRCPARVELHCLKLSCSARTFVGSVAAPGRATTRVKVLTVLIQTG